MFFFVKDGRITKGDLLEYLENKQHKEEPGRRRNKKKEEEEEVKIVPLNFIQKEMAKAMKISNEKIPHLSLMEEIYIGLFVLFFVFFKIRIEIIKTKMKRKNL